MYPDWKTAIHQTSLDTNCFPHRATEANDTNVTEYQAMVGCINWLVVGTRPDLAFTASMLGTSNSQPSTVHMAQAKQVLRYIKGTHDFRLAIRETFVAHTGFDYACRCFHGEQTRTMPNRFSGYMLQNE